MSITGKRSGCFKSPASLAAAGAERHAASNRAYSASDFSRQSTWANCLSASLISASSSRTGMKRLCWLVGSRKRAVWRSRVTQSEAKAWADMASTRVREASSPRSMASGMESPGRITHSSNQTRSPSPFSRWASSRTAALSLELWLRKTSYSKSCVISWCAPLLNMRNFWSYRNYSATKSQRHEGNQIRNLYQLVALKLEAAGRLLCRAA